MTRPPDTRFADLHLHTNQSDGVDPPARVVERAVKLGFAAIAITDHDSVSAVHEAQPAAEAAGLEFFPGVEISADYEGLEIHIVGLGVATAAGPFHDALELQRDERSTRASRIIERLNEIGVPVTREAVDARVPPHGALGRLHIAQEIRDLGFTKSVQGAFDKYIGRGQSAFVRMRRLPHLEAIVLIQEAGGVAILGHPGLGPLKKIVRTVLDAPFDGIEAYHSRHTPNQSAEFLRFAQERGLLVSGGSDCHGAAKTRPEMGSVRLPYEYVERIKETLAARQTR
jgi:3',5'-nucleoside bisphosphate phosphatase